MKVVQLSEILLAIESGCDVRIGCHEGIYIDGRDCGRPAGTVLPARDQQPEGVERSADAREIYEQFGSGWISLVIQCV